MTKTLADMTAKKYRKKPVEVEAVQFTGDNADVVAEWCGGAAAPSVVPAPGRGLKTVLNIFTLEGKMQAVPGDYIIKGGVSASSTLASLTFSPLLMKR